MYLLKKISALILCLLIYGNTIFADQKIAIREAKVLEPLIKSILQHAEAGYVLFDKKPVSTISYLQYPFFWDKIDPFDQMSIALHAALDALKHPLFHSGNILFHIDTKDETLLVINRQLFLKTVKENLSLFQYILGPLITPQLLLEEILSPDHAFCEVLNNDRVLIGIVLGFGAQNSLFESRWEHIDCDGIFSKELPPFPAHSTLCPNDDLRLELLFADQDEGPKWKKGQRVLKPSYGFSSIAEEIEEITKRIVVSSEKLCEPPRFIFGCLKDSEENQIFLRELEAAQEKIVNLLQSPTCFEEALAIICGEKVEVETAESYALPSPTEDKNLLIAKLFMKDLKKHGKNHLTFFIEGLIGNDKDLGWGGDYIGTSTIALENARAAKKNLEEADRFFAQFKKNKAFKPILEPYLYFKTLEHGAGPSLKNETELCIDYKIFTPSGKCLCNESHAHLNLQETIPGFAHGLRGMQQGEKRLIYIHPSLAYGVYTYLEKGIYLKAEVELREIFDSKGNLPKLIAADLSLVKSDQFQNKCEEDYKLALRFTGFKKRQFLQLFPEIDIPSIARALASMKDSDTPSQEELTALNQLFWNLYFAKT